MNDNTSLSTLTRPVLPLRAMVVLPSTSVRVDVGRPKSKAALTAAQTETSNEIFLMTQREANNHDPSAESLHSVGVIAHVQHMVQMPDLSVQVMLLAKERAELVEMFDFEGDPDASMLAKVRLRPDVALSPEDRYAAERLISEAKIQFEDYQRQNRSINLDNYQLETLREMTDPRVASYQLIHLTSWDVADKQRLLEMDNLLERVEAINSLLARDIERFALDKRIASRVKEQMDTNQREYYLREQMKAIGQELGGGEDTQSDAAELREQVQQSGMPESVKEKALKEIARYERTSGGSPESSVARNYIEWLLDLPWDKRDNEILDIARTERILNEDHHGLEDVKDRILEFLAVRQLTQGEANGEKGEKLASDRADDGELRAPILCLVGPPGVGKTSLGKSIARSLDRKFVRMALGGLRDEAEVRGHRRTYIGSMPGKILQGMKQAGVINPVVLLDEIDKMSSDWRGDPSSAMLEVLDPEQNHTFQDHYLEVPYDLSQTMFITTANSLSTIPKALLDRMEVIEIPGYTQAEKVKIAEEYRVPRQVKAHGLEGKLAISTPALVRVVEEYTAESGIRNLDRLVGRICRKMARKYLTQPWEGLRTVEAEDVGDLLGVPTEQIDRMEAEAQVGVAQGLAWTSVGGAMLVVEALATPGKGNVTMTGSLGDVMKESVAAAVAYLRANAERHGADPEFHKKLDLHVHFPDGATPKEGPSAGITIATAVISAITGRPARMDVAMTGEISLRGRVLQIGGVKEKLLAAHQGGIREVIVPKDNAPHLQEVPKAILQDLKVHTFSDVGQVLELVLLPEPTEVPSEG